LPLPKTVFAHGWIYYEQDKMSKSKGNVVYPEPIIKAFEEFGAPGNDALRYYLLRDTPFGLDGSFSYEGLIQRYNSDLANDLGNLANRTITMLNRYFGGVVPTTDSDPTPLEMELKAETFGGSYRSGSQTVTSTGYLQPFQHEMDNYLPHVAALSIWTVVSLANGYLVKREPWKHAESDSPGNGGAVAQVMYTALNLLRVVAPLAYPLIPESASSLWSQLGCEGAVEDQRIDQLRWDQLKPGTKVGKPEPIFPRLDKEKTLRRLYELAEEDRLRDQKPKETSTKVESPSEQKPVNLQSQISGSEARKITIEDFAKVDLRAGTIISAEPIPGATKLLKLQVDIGSEVRQVCAGIAEYYKPEELIGMKVVIVANLQPRKMRGVESNGMIVAASVGEQGKPVLVTFKEEVPNGARLK